MFFKYRILIAAGIGAAIMVAVWGYGQFQYRSGVQDGRATVRMELSEITEATRQRVREADVGTGDENADLDWLRAYVDSLQPAAGE